MLNHFRTLLLNISDEGEVSEHIPTNFNQLSYKEPLQAFHNLIMPARLSRFNKQFLAHNYMSYIEAAGIPEAITLLDARVTYDLTDKSSYFQFNRLSNVIGSDPTVVATPKGQYINTIELDSYSEQITIQQLSDAYGVGTNNIAIYQVDDNLHPIKYYNTSSTLTFDNSGISNIVSIGNTGLTVQFYSPTNFTSSLGKSWSFIVDHPILFNVDTTLSKVNNNTSLVESMLTLAPEVDSSKYDSLWRHHNNKVYRLAGLISSFVLRAGNKDNSI